MRGMPLASTDHHVDGPCSILTRWSVPGLSVQKTTLDALKRIRQIDSIGVSPKILQTVEHSRIFVE